MACAFTPWLSQEEAGKLVYDRAVRSAKDIPNLCQLSIDESSLHKVPFGYKEKVSFDCPATDHNYGIAKGTSNVWITFYKGLWGMPEKVVAR